MNSPRLGRVSSGFNPILVIQEFRGLALVRMSSALAGRQRFGASPSCVRVESYLRDVFFSRDGRRGLCDFFSRREERPSLQATQESPPLSSGLQLVLPVNAGFSATRTRVSHCKGSNPGPWEVTRRQARADFCLMPFPFVTCLMWTWAWGLHAS